MGKENQSSAASFEWSGFTKEDMVFNTAEHLLYLSDEFTKENIDEAIELATYLYDRVYDNKKSVKDEEKDEIDNQKIQYLEEVIKTATDMLEKCKKNKQK